MSASPLHAVVEAVGAVLADGPQVLPASRVRARKPRFVGELPWVSVSMDASASTATGLGGVLGSGEQATLQRTTLVAGAPDERLPVGAGSILLWPPPARDDLEVTEVFASGAPDRILTRVEPPTAADEYGFDPVERRLHLGAPVAAGRTLELRYTTVRWAEDRTGRTVVGTLDLEFWGPSMAAASALCEDGLAALELRGWVGGFQKLVPRSLEAAGPYDGGGTGVGGTGAGGNWADTWRQTGSLEFILETRRPLVASEGGLIERIDIRAQGAARDEFAVGADSSTT